MCGESERHDVVIRLLNENGHSVIGWKLHRAFPVKWVAADVTPDANEVAIETLELAHEGIVVCDE